MSIVRSMHDEMVGWCRGRWWVFRGLLLAWFAYMLVRFLMNPAYSPLFHALNLGIHEIGHIIWSPLGQFMSFLGGSLTQCVVPLGSIYMFHRQKDFFAMAFCLGWFGINLFSVAVYVGDAQARALPLVTPFGGEPIHDWHYLLGQMGLLEWSGALSGLLMVAGTVTMLTFLVVGAYQLFLMATLSPPPTEEEAFEADAVRAVESRDF